MTPGRWKAGIAVGVVAAAGLLVASTSRADRPQMQHAAAGCPSLARVASFNALVNSVSFSGSVTGKAPGAGGTETIGLLRDASNLRVTLGGKVAGPLPGFGVVTFFSGKSKTGAVSAKDTFAMSGGGPKGTVNAIGLPKLLSATVLLSSKLCAYQLMVTYVVKNNFTGDAAIKPGLSITGSAITPRRPIPASLKLSGVATIHSYLSGCARSTPPDPQGCFQFGGSWALDFDTLERCGSIVAVNCGPPDKPEGTAHIRWSASPTFAK